MLFTKIIQHKKKGKTTYRIVSDGIIWHLQYLEETHFLSLIKLSTWKYIRRPALNSNGRQWIEGCSYQTYICSYNCVLNEFIEKWENIQDYLTWAATEQKVLELQVTHYNAACKQAYAAPGFPSFN